MSIFPNMYNISFIYQYYFLKKMLFVSKNVIKGNQTHKPNTHLMKAGCLPSLRKLGEQTDSLPTVESPVGPPDLPAASPTHTCTHTHTHIDFT